MARLSCGQYRPRADLYSRTIVGQAIFFVFRLCEILTGSDEVAIGVMELVDLHVVLDCFPCQIGIVKTGQLSQDRAWETMQTVEE